MVRLNPLVHGVAFVAVLGTACTNARVEDVQPTVILVSLDGFRWDFREIGNTPTLDSLATVGVTADYMIPVFPTMTFPSHYSMATGLYPEHHGIVSNRMFDPARDAWFAIDDRAAVEDGAWWDGEPIWLTAERQGVTAATFFWPGTETAINGRHATYWYRFDASIPNVDRVDQIIEWLGLPAKQRPQLITLYFEDVDQAVHNNSLGSRRVQRSIADVDASVRRLTAGITSLGLHDKVDIVIVSDHGMAERSPERVIFLDDFVDLGAVDVIDWSPILMASAADGDDERLYKQLDRAHPRLTVYRRDEMPDRYHFRDNDRIPPIIGIADEGWSISTRSFFARNPGAFEGHTHGYDNRAETMRTIFIASGPAFANGRVVPAFESVHLYELVCAILGIEPAQNDGNLAAVRGVLR